MSAPQRATTSSTPTGRFAPSPSGRMHLGNIFAALISWLSVKSKGGKWILRIEDLDPQRSRREYARLIEDDLIWLGLHWDEGGLDNKGSAGPYIQSQRMEIYEKYLSILSPYTYPCTCRRADILATQAPHQSDGRIIYAGTCRPSAFPAPPNPAPHSTRILVPDEDITFTDRLYGPQTVNLANQCGDFILRRTDGAWAYQLAVVIDDALMGVTEIVRGSDLLLSAAQQIFLYRTLQLDIPEYAHIPLLATQEENGRTRRLSKRDNDASLEYLRSSTSPEIIIGKLAQIAGLRPTDSPISAEELIPYFHWDKLTPLPEIILR